MHFVNSTYRVLILFKILETLKLILLIYDSHYLLFRAAIVSLMPNQLFHAHIKKTFENKQ